MQLCVFARVCACAHRRSQRDKAKRERERESKCNRGCLRDRQSDRGLGIEEFLYRQRDRGMPLIEVSL